MIILENQTIKLTGAWILAHIPELDQALRVLPQWQAGEWLFDGSGLTAFDTSGALRLSQCLHQVQQVGGQVTIIGLTDEQTELLELITQRLEQVKAEIPEAAALSWVASIGQAVMGMLGRAVSLLSFMGEVAVVFWLSLLKPWTIRWKSVLVNIETGGVQALPIVGLLNFLIGVVIAYQGSVLLKTYGANIFIVELVTISMVRELAPLITAIIMAGRTGSAYAAQIGTMVVTEEVDALKTIGINPLEQLVLPKMLALIVALPLLTLFANMVSVFGGMVLSVFMLDVSFYDFVARIPQVMTVASLLVGLAKSLVFAMVIALVGCYQGLQVKGGADSVGRQTTMSVVQAIFLVIIVDTVFSIVTSSVPL